MASWQYVVLLAGVCLAGGKSDTTEPPSTGTVEPVLAPDAALLRSIADLGDNSWLKLPTFKVAGELQWLPARADERTRGPFGRSYCNHAFYAPERRRAVYCGGGHNVRPINDVWEYDLASNTWVCLRGADPPFRPREAWFRANATIQFGLPATQSGAMVRMSHTWDQATYDPERKLLIVPNSMPRSLTYSVKLEKEGNPFEKGLGLQHEDLLKKLGPDGIYAWAFDPAKRQWVGAELIANWKGPGNTIGGRQESGIMEYMPDTRTLWFAGYRGPLVRNRRTGEWEKASRSFHTYGTVGVYDRREEKIVITGGRKTWLCDPVTGERELVNSESPDTNDASGLMVYDTAAGKVVLYTTRQKPHLWTYDTVSNTWTDPKPLGERPGPGRQRVVYYDEARNVTVYYDSVSIHVYRAKRRDAAKGSGK